MLKPRTPEHRVGQVSTRQIPPLDLFLVYLILVTSLATVTRAAVILPSFYRTCSRENCSSVFISHLVPGKLLPGMTCVGEHKSSPYLAIFTGTGLSFYYL